MKLYDSGIKQTTMTVTYKDGCKIIHHPTGMVQELDDKDLLVHKIEMEERKTKIELKITNAAADMAKVNSVAKASIAKINAT